MILTTTHAIEGRRITDYKGIVVGEAIMGANIVRDVFASITDIVGGRSGAYESKLQEARDTALRELEARAEALGVRFHYQTTAQSLKLDERGAVVGLRARQPLSSAQMLQPPLARGHALPLLEEANKGRWMAIAQSRRHGVNGERRIAQKLFT